MQLPATQRMELVAHMQSASEPRAKPLPSRENDFAGSSKTSMMAFPVAVTKGLAFALQYPTESVGFSGSLWTWFGLGRTWRSLMRYQTLTVAAEALILSCVLTVATPAVAQTRLLNVSYDP